MATSTLTKPTAPVSGPRPLFIDGEWIQGAGNAFDVLNPATGGRIGEVYEATRAEVDAAVAAARRSFDSKIWRGLAADARAQILWRVAELIDANAAELAAAESRNLGAPAYLANYMASSCATAFRYYSTWCSNIYGRARDASNPAMDVLAYTRQEPIGVAGLITPWNAPLMMATWKLGPALAAGCSVVLKPAEQTPLTTLRLVELLIEAGIPRGVVNVVTGHGDVGAMLTEHPGIDKISFTGSTDVGRRIVRAAAGNLKRVTLELGGKSPFIIDADADLARAAPTAAAAIYNNSGQVCTCGSRLFIHRSRFDETVETITGIAASLKVGDPIDPAVNMGPLISERQRQRVAELVDSGKQAGAEVVFGGSRIDGDGFFFKPTLLTGTDPSMRVVREEIFGPVVCAIPFDTPEELAAQVNNTEYGLAAYIWTRDISRAHKLAAHISSGSVYVNSGGIVDYTLPQGGFKSWGWGREHGPEGVSAYLETKSVVVSL